MTTQTQAIPKLGTLERTMFDALLEKGNVGVTIFDLEGTGINEDNIDEIVENLKTGNFEPDSCLRH